MSETTSSSEEDEFIPGLEEYDEFDEPCKMGNIYCKQLSREQYEEQTENETQKALLQLMTNLTKDPYLFRSVLLKRKKEDMENAGFLSYLKVKLLSIVHGNNCPVFSVTEQEVNSKLDDLMNGMQKAFDYAKEAKCRRSKRIEAKRNNKNVSIRENKSPDMIPQARNKSPARIPQARNKSPARIPQARNKSPARIPQAPPIPPPLPVKFKTPKRKVTPLGDRNIEVDTPESMRARKIMKRVGSGSSLTSFSSLGSLSSLHVELMSANHLRHLRSTNKLRSPGGTPLSRRKAYPNSPSTVTEPLYRAFLTTMKHKFRNARSPSPAPGGLYNNCVSPRSASNSPDCTFTP